jgi:ribosomal protein S18 acetylase RimI-like enzyme
VNPEFENMGFGKLLLNAIEMEFNHSKRFELFTSSKSEKNLSLYKKQGYNEFKELVSESLVLIFLEKLN